MSLRVGNPPESAYNIHQEQSAAKSVSYVSQVLVLSKVFSSLWIQSSSSDKIFHLCEVVVSRSKLLLSSEPHLHFSPALRTADECFL